MLSVERTAECVRESNRIEGIHRPPTRAEIDLFWNFMQLDRVTLHDMQNAVEIMQPGTKLRLHPGMDVEIGRHTPPGGGVHVGDALTAILEAANNTQSWEGAYRTHLEYETLHPFMDGNGRSGRLLWYWQCLPRGFELGFLHSWYYQTLQYGSGR